MNIGLFHCAMYTYNTENTRNLDSNAWDSLSSLNCLANVEYLFFGVYLSFVQLLIDVFNGCWDISAGREVVGNPTSESVIASLQQWWSDCNGTGRIKLRYATMLLEYLNQVLLC